MASKFRHEWTERAADDLRKLMSYLVKELGNMPVAYSIVSQEPLILASDPLLKEGGSRCAADG
jgi:hypothetical protein